MLDIKDIADKADVIINGYAFTREQGKIHVLNLNCPDRVAALANQLLRSGRFCSTAEGKVNEYRCQQCRSDQFHQQG